MHQSSRLSQTQSDSGCLVPKERAEAAGAEGVERLEAEVARRRAAEGRTEELSAEVSTRPPPDQQHNPTHL